MSSGSCSKDMKDYNLHYYYLKLPLDATTEEVERAYEDEVKACAGFSPHQMQERMVNLRAAR